MCLWQCNLVLQDIIDTDAPSSFNLLFGALLVLLAHVHDCSGTRAVELVTVEALVLLVDLVGHPAVLAHALLLR